MKKYLFMLPLILLGSCTSNHKDTVDVKYKPKAKLVLQKKMVYPDSGEVYIGDIKNMVVIKNRIYISDRTNFKIHVFNKNLKYIKSSPGYGRGPGEFTTSPYLSNNNGKIMICGVHPHKIEYLDSNFVVYKSITEPLTYTTDASVTPVFRKNKILIPAFNRIISRRSKNYSGITTAVLFKYNGDIINNICPIDNIYNIHSVWAYYNHPWTMVSNGFHKSFIILQAATTKFQNYDKNGNYIQTLHYKPRFYIDPPSYTWQQLRAMTREDVYKNYYTKETYLKSLFFDERNNLLYLNYERQTMNDLYTRSLFDRNNWLAVIDSLGECIYDDKIEGFMGDVADGIIYSVVKDNPLTINKYAVEIK